MWTDSVNIVVVWDDILINSSTIVRFPRMPLPHLNFPIFRWNVSYSDRNLRNANESETTRAFIFLFSISFSAGAFNYAPAFILQQVFLVAKAFN